VWRWKVPRVRGSARRAAVSGVQRNNYYCWNHYYDRKSHKCSEQNPRRCPQGQTCFALCQVPATGQTELDTIRSKNVKLDNFSTSWSDGMAFCALIHHFLPEAYDYTKLLPTQRRHNFTLAFKVADEKAGIYPLLDVEDMVTMRKPDWKCVFTYVQAIHRRFKDQD